MATREWKKIKDFQEILFEEYNGIAKITINRPRYRNAFTPRTTLELSQAFAYCREASRISVVILTGAGDKAFCSGGDMHVKGRGGYVDEDGVPRLSVLDVQMQIRRLPKPVIAMVNGYAIGGGHVLHLVCDLSIASENAIFGQTGPKVGSFDAGLERATLPVAWVRRRPARYGSFAASIRLPRQSAWDLSTRSFHLSDWRMSVWSGLRQ